MTMKIAVMIVVAFAAFPAPAVGASEATIVVVPDPPTVAAKPFLDFFYHYNRLMYEWWTSGGRELVRGGWEVLVGTDAPANAALAAAGGHGYSVLIAAVRSGEGSRPVMVAKVPPAALQYPLAAARAAVEKTKAIITKAKSRRREVRK